MMQHLTKILFGMKFIITVVIIKKTMIRIADMMNCK